MTLSESPARQMLLSLTCNERADILKHMQVRFMIGCCCSSQAIC
jgi:hypothetical protein